MGGGQIDSSGLPGRARPVVVIGAPLQGEGGAVGVQTHATAVVRCAPAPTRRHGGAAENAPLAGVVTDAVTGAVLSRVKVIALPVKALPTLSVAFACTVYVPSPSDAHVGNVALLVHVAAVLPLVATWVVARSAAPACQAEPVQ